ncbi:ABC transporter [Phytophthora megakarya]|uniref:ABC transporter n=1 Tax=Phytophthora megakarya TaxID=4795 RepID=A0A225WN34_9STRA|nr:ABC transporter [Phytophthora megakarya]
MRYGTFDGSIIRRSAHRRVRRRSSSPPSSGASNRASLSSKSPDSAPVAREPCLVDEASASWLSRLGFLFVEPLVAIGGVRRLCLQDLWTLEPENTAEQAEKHFRAAYSASGGLLSAIWRTEWRAIVCSGGLGLCSALSACCVPILLFKLLTSAMDPEQEHKSVLELLVLLVAIHVAVMLTVLFDRHARFRMFKAQLRVVASIRLLVFSKSVERPVKGRHGTSTSIASIATLYSSNLVQVSWLIIRFHDMWTSTLQLAVLLLILHRTLHTSATVILSSLAVIIGGLSVLTALSAKMLQWYTKKRTKTLAAVNECFKGIQSIKLYAWEDKILSKIMSNRRKEEKRKWWEASFRILRYCCVWEAPAFASVAIFTSLAARAGFFSPATVFTALILIDHVQVELHGLIMGIRVLIDGRVGLRKIDHYLRYCDTFANSFADGTGVEAEPKSYPDGVVAAMDNVDFVVGHRFPMTVLKNVNLRVNVGELVVIHGKAGAGKSTLLTGFLGDVSYVKGSVYLSQSYKIAYCSEQPWLQTLSIRDNVLFGYPYDEDKYYRVLDVCCLLEDLESLPDGDETMIGPKGINLSGGQKSRIALARTLYSDADVYLLDRPLASADAIVQSDVFRKCFLELLRYKTVIVATHNPEFIESGFVDRLWHVNENGVSESFRGGTGATSRRARRLTDIPPWRSNRKEKTGDEHATIGNNGQNQESQKRIPCRSAPKLSAIPRCDLTLSTMDEVAKEICTMDKVAKEIWWPTKGRHCSIAAGMLFITYGLVDVAKNLWLVHWSNMTWTYTDMWNATIVYSLLSIGAFLILLVSCAVVFYALSRRAKIVFSEVTRSLLRAPMSVLYQTPIGEILARYSTDMQVIDGLMSFPLVFMFRSTVSIAAALGTMCYLLGVPGAIFAAVTVYLCRGMVDKRLFAQVFSLRAELDAADLNFVSETLDGAAVIRSFGDEQVDRVCQHHGRMVDDRSRIATVVEVFTHWLYIRCSLLVAAFLFCLALLLAHGKLEASTLGLMLHCIYSVQRDFVSFSVGILNSSVNMFSIANLKKFQHIKPEERTALKGAQQRLKAPLQWPTAGAVVFDHVFFRYNTDQENGDLSTVALKDVSFSIAGGEKIGVVGRTGSGKSSLAMAMLQMHDLPTGRILIDGVDISRLHLRDIRSRICIIPQTPLFYRCSIRRYLDPFKEFDDGPLWEVLVKTGLCDTPGPVEQIDETIGEEVYCCEPSQRVVVTNLDMRLAENGENWSMGERQMLVLARSLLKPARILILDEAFSSVDQDCDKRLLAVIEKEFANSTIFLITHRLDQVLGFDRIIVMQNGTLVECGAAEDLVSDPDSVFYEFLETTLLTF